MFKKKILSMLLVTGMAVSLLGGCGNNNVDDEPDNEKESSSEEEEADNKSQEEDPATEDGFEHDPVLNDLGVEPICKETVTLTVGIKSSANVEDYETNYYTQLIEETANVDLEFIVYPAAEATEKLRMQVAGGEKLPDIIMWRISDAEMMGWGAEDYFIAMDDYFEHSVYYATDTIEYYKEKGMDLVDMVTTIDGHVWQFPKITGSITNGTPAKLWVYEPWLTAVGMTQEDIKDIDDFYEMLVAFKTQDPNGNGIADEIPMLGFTLGQSSTHPWVYVMNAFQHTTLEKQFLFSTDGELSASFTTDEFKEGVKFINKLVTEGLYDSVSFSQDNATWKSILNNPGDQLVGCFVSTSTSCISSDHPSKEDWVLFDPLVGTDGYCSTSGWGEDGANGYVSISADCEHPEVAFRVFDLMSSEYLSIVARYGKEGENWMYAEDAKKEYPDADWSMKFGDYEPYILEFNTAHGTLNNNTWQDGNCVAMRTDIITGGANSAAIATGLGDASISEIGKHHSNYMSALPDEIISMIKYTSVEEQEQAAKLYTDIYNLVIEKLTAWFTGTADVEEEWDDYLATLESLGLSEWLEINQRGVVLK